MKYAYVKKTEHNERILSNFPSAGPNASIKGMREKFWGKDAFIVKCGSYIYNIDKNTFYRYFY